MDNNNDNFLFQIESISELYTKHDSENNKNITYFYAVFTTSKYSITASAVCMFTLDQIMTSFHGDYKQKEDHLSQNEMNSNLKHTKSNTMPVPKPSECPSKLTYQHLMFSRKNFIMQNEILSEALIVETSSQNRFQSIDTDFNINNNNNDMDILFIGTDNGRVLTFAIENDKFHQNDTEIKKKLIYSEELIVFNEEKKINFDYVSTNQINKRSTATNTSNNININEQDDNESILNIKFYKNETQRRQFILTTKNRVLSIPANYCSLKSTANKCNSQLYPYCVWSKNINKCVDFDSINLDDDTTTATNQDLFILISNSSLNNSETISINNLTSIDQLLIANNNTNLFLIQSFFDADNTKITISMNFILFILSIIAFLILSFLIGIATTYFIYIHRQKIQSKPSLMISKKKQNDNDFIVKINTNSITVNDIKRVVENTNRLGGGGDCSQLYSTVKSKNKRESVTNATSSIVSCSSSASSASSISPFGDSTTKSTLIDNEDPRYVYINNNKSQLPISILGISNLMINDQKFQDYDESEYFTLRKNKQFNNQTSVMLPISADSSSSSSPNSAQTNTSTTKLVRHNNNNSNNNNTTNYEINNLNYYNRVLPTISVKCIEKHNNSSITTTTTSNNKKYYI